MSWHARRWFRFSVRSMLIAVAIASIWFSWRVRAVREVDTAVAQLLRNDLQAVWLNDDGYFASRPWWQRVVAGQGKGGWVVYWAAPSLPPDDRGWPAGGDLDDPERKRINDTVILSLIDDLHRLGRIKQLELCGFTVGDKSARELAGLPIETLNLGHTNLGDEGLAALQSCAGLRWLDVEHTRVTDAGIERFRRELPGCNIERD